MDQIVKVDRRDFLKATGVAAGGLVVGFMLPVKMARAAAAPAAFTPNAYLQVGGDNIVTVLVGKLEFGQGVYTSLPLIVAEELDADWNQVKVKAAPAADAFKHPGFGIQMTGGSTSVVSEWDRLRKAGATARAMLLQAAAEELKVDVATLRTENGAVVDAKGRRIAYGRLAARAAKLPVPAEVKLKDPSTFRLVGRKVLRVEGPDKVTGKAQFGLDVRLPKMLVAVVARAPVFGATLRRHDDTAAKAVKGVKAVKRVPSGVAVIAGDFWSAKKGRDALVLEWDNPATPPDSDGLSKAFGELLGQPGIVARDQGDVAAELAAAKTRVEARYEVPYLAHAAMEPLNCTVQIGKDGCDIWAGSQFQTVDQAAAAKTLNLPPEKVRLHTQLAGGGFGRRANPVSDYIVEAVEVARDMGVPVKTVWTREDDMRGGYYRPAYASSLAAGVDAQGNLSAWRQRIVGQSIVAGTPFESVLVKDGVDHTSVEGAADMPYDIDAQRVDLHSPRTGIPVLWWRSVGHSWSGFVNECFLDEVAAAAGRDPYHYRRRLLAKQPRHLRVLDLAAEKAAWDTPLPAGRGRGIAIRESFSSIVAEVVEVSMEGGKVKVHKVTAAVDCGLAVNPDGVKAQIEGAVAFALSAALYGRISFKDGQVEQSNFHDYPVIRLPEMPVVEVHIVPGGDKPTGGLGEPGVPPLAPALVNAVYSLTGKRVRRLPLSLEGLA